MKKITIAIDGYSSCGKSTMAKDLAREIGYVYVDTGAMYRSVTLFAMRNNLFDDGGIKAGEKYVTNGVTKLNDGAQITPITPEEYAKRIKQAESMGAMQK